MFFQTQDFHYEGGAYLNSCGQDRVQKMFEQYVVGLTSSRVTGFVVVSIGN